MMKRIFVPTKSGSDWQRLLAQPKLHWKAGASAMTAAAAWEASVGELPSEITRLLDSPNEAPLKDLRLLLALPEWQVPLPGGTTNSSTDILAICRNDLGLCVIGVEAKVFEDFGPLMSEKRDEASSGQADRLSYLHELLGVKHFENSIRYQLLHRTASVLLTAREFHASAAVMLIHAFDTPASMRVDFEAFTTALNACQIAPLVYKVPAFENPGLYLAWCGGNSEFRKIELPDGL